MHDATRTPDETDELDFDLGFGPTRSTASDFAVFRAATEAARADKVCMGRKADGTPDVIHAGMGWHPGSKARR